MHQDFISARIIGDTGNKFTNSLQEQCMQIPCNILLSAFILFFC